MNVKIFYFLTFLLFQGFIIKAQNAVEGVVTNTSGELMTGVNVTVKGSTRTVSTNNQGYFSILTSGPEDVLVFSYVGYKKQERIVSTRAKIDIVLEEESKDLDNVVVVGYGTQSRELLTTSISKLDSRVLEKTPMANPATALQGTVSGVRVQTTTGQPGAAARVIVRGGTSINNPNGAAPLYIVDGVIRNGLVNINANDIETMQVLKDAASTSIYGARGSNGVVIITTKSGRNNSSKVNYRYNLMASNVGKLYDLVSAEEFIKFYRNGVVALARKIPERMVLLSQATAGGTGNDLSNNTAFTTQYLTPENSYKLDEGWSSMPDPVDPSKTIIFKETDWQKILYRTGLTHEHNLTFSGGTEKATFNLGVGYLNNEGTAVGTDYKRLSLNLNGSLQAKDFLKIFSRAMYSRSNQNGDSWGYDRGQAISPTAKYMFEDGTLAPGANSNYRNPVYYNNSRKVVNLNDNLTLISGANLTIAPGLTFDPQISLLTTSGNSSSFQKAAYLNGPLTLDDSRSASASNVRSIQWQADAVMSYDKSFTNAHNISVKGGFAYYSLQNNTLTANGRGAASDLIPTLNASSTPVSVFSEESRQVILGYFFRVNYDHKSKYLLTINGRYDGASNLGNNFKWGLFPGVSVGWNIHQEEFWENIPALISGLKLRGSYGVNGNISGLGRYEAQGVYAVGSRYGGNSGVVNSVIPNSELQWEKSKTLNFGFDLSLLNNRISFISDIYRRVTDNLLTSLPLPPSTGFSSVRTNFGSLENKGVEIELSYKIFPVSSEFQWDISFNASKVKNKILQLPNNGVDRNRVGGLYLWDPSKNDYVWLGGLQEGSAIGDIFGFKQVSIYSTDEEANKGPVDMIIGTTDKKKFGGDVNWFDLDKNDTIDLRDRMYMGNIYPKWTGGVSTYFTYKNISLGIRMDYTAGHVKYNWSRALILAQYGTASGITTDVLRSWQKSGDITDIPQYYWADQQSQRNISRVAADINGGNSQFYESAGYLCLREISLSYSLPTSLIRKLKMSDLTISLTGHNLRYFTKYKGLSPEDGGQDFGGYPPPRNLIFGLNVSF